MLKTISLPEHFRYVSALGTTLSREELAFLLHPLECGGDLS